MIKYISQSKQGQYQAVIAISIYQAKNCSLKHSMISLLKLQHFAKMINNIHNNLKGQATVFVVNARETITT